MSTLLRQFRPLLIGLLVLMLAAGTAIAGKPSTPAAGLTVAAENSGKTVPVQAQQGDEDGDEEPDADEPAEPAGENGGANCATDPSNLSNDDLAAMRHGSVVCWAAHQETPEEYDNHGQFVSEWARKNHGQSSGHGQSAEHGKPPAP